MGSVRIKLGKGKAANEAFHRGQGFGLNMLKRAVLEALGLRQWPLAVITIFCLKGKKVMHR